MPELPEVETILRGITPHVTGQRVQKIVVRQPKLRWMIPLELIKQLPLQTIKAITRRGKYLLFHTEVGVAVLHFGMSGNIKILGHAIPPQKHDHVDIIFEEFYLRYNDPRRFGSLLWSEKDVSKFHLLADLGIEPLDDNFKGNYLFQLSRNKQITIKQFIMDSHIVVGVGNIYASESLFLANIRPFTKANEIDLKRYRKLVSKIKYVLEKAIEQGGTTLRDFRNSEGKPGYFKQDLNVYGREGKACKNCSNSIKQVRIQQRSTFYCPSCQI